MASAKDATRRRITVLGTGYLGATHAVCMTELGHEVIGVDVDEKKVARLAAGEVPFFEPGLPELLRKNLDTGRLRFTTSFAEAADAADLHFVCVGTPQRRDEYAADLSQVDAAFDALAPHLTGRSLVVGKSTVPTGTAARLATRLRRGRPPGPGGARLEPGVPARRARGRRHLAPGPPRLWRPVGVGRAAPAVGVLRLIGAGCPVVVTDFATAELVKVAANSFLATKISFINAMAEVCEVAHADVTRLSEALGYDERIGPQIPAARARLRRRMPAEGHPGVHGAGGRAGRRPGAHLPHRRRRDQHAPPLAHRRPGARGAGGSFRGARVALLGAAFKPNSDDIRDSPALDVAASVQRQGARVVVFDPVANEQRPPGLPRPRVRRLPRRCRPGQTSSSCSPSGRSSARWTRGIGEVVARRNIVDGRNALDPVRWRAAGWTYRALGRP